jgi:hypothetical protein
LGLGFRRFIHEESPWIFATSNTAFGYRVTNRTGGTASGNTAVGNGDNTLPAP